MNTDQARKTASAVQSGNPQTGTRLPVAHDELARKRSLRISLADALSQMFTFEKSAGLKSVLVFALSLMVFSWFADSLLPLIQEVGQWLIGTLRSTRPAHEFADLLKKLAVPAALFAAVALGLVINALRNARPRRYESAVPDPHAGLIVQLSDYSRLNPGRESLYATAAEIASAVESGQLDLVEVFKSNWGPMAFAVRYHAPVLRYCWVICTAGERGSGKDFISAESLINAITKAESGRGAQCFLVKLADENDIGLASQKVNDIYRNLSEHAPGLRVSDVIADFTGGTAAMSGGMILATLDESQEIEYLRRGVTLTVDLDAAAVRERRVIVSPRISRRMVERLVVK